jgi:hypothetical protein
MSSVQSTANGTLLGLRDVPLAGLELLFDRIEMGLRLTSELNFKAF